MFMRHKRSPQQRQFEKKRTFKTECECRKSGKSKRESKTTIVWASWRDKKSLYNLYTFHHSNEWCITLAHILEPFRQDQREWKRFENNHFTMILCWMRAAGKGEVDEMERALGEEKKMSSFVSLIICTQNSSLFRSPIFSSSQFNISTSSLCAELALLCFSFSPLLLQFIYHFSITCRVSSFNFFFHIVVVAVRCRIHNKIFSVSVAVCRMRLKSVVRTNLWRWNVFGEQQSNKRTKTSCYFSYFISWKFNFPTTTRRILPHTTSSCASKRWRKEKLK